MSVGHTLYHMVLEIQWCSVAELQRKSWAGRSEGEN